MKMPRSAATALTVLGLVFVSLVAPALASPSTLDARFQSQFQEAYRMLHQGAETGDSELLARGQQKLQTLLAQLEAAMQAHPRDAKLKDLLRSVMKTSGSAVNLDEAALDTLDRQLTLP